jgi:aminocarboxymuconate-semialdehyde decarboxylase
MVTAQHQGNDEVVPAPVIDVHAHAVLEMSLGAAGAAGPELGTSSDGTPFYRVGDYLLNGVKYRGSPFMDVDVRLAAMDRAGIDRQLLSPNPLTYFTHLDGPTAIRYCSAHNDALAEVVRAHPDRLLGAAQMPLQDVDASIRELQRCVRDLGLVAPYIDTDPGRSLDDPAMDDFYAAAVELDVPVFVHPTPLGPDGPPEDPRMRRFDLDLLFGFARDETLAVAALIFGGVLERHPELDVCLSHGGGTVAYVAGRFSRAAEVPRPWVPDFLHDNGFEHYLRRLWLDTHVHSAEALALLVDVAGSDHLVLGTNFAGWDSGTEAVTHVGDLLSQVSENAARLLRLG